MFIKLIRKLGKILRGGASSRDVVLGAIFGVMLGMTPGFGLLTIALLVLVLILNANIGVITSSFTLGKALCYALAPYTFRIGFNIIHLSGMEGTIRNLAEKPVWALINLDNYCLVGGFPIAVVVGIIAGILLALVINSLRKGIVMATTKSKKMEALAKNPIVRLILRVLFGKQKEGLAEQIEKKPPLFRKSGAILAIVVVVLVVGMQLLFISAYGKKVLIAALEYAYGAEVNIENADISVLGGKLSLGGVQITDRAKPTHDCFYAKELTADFSVSQLLAKRFVVEKLAIGKVELDHKRATPGKVYVKPDKVKPEKKTPETETKKSGDYITDFFEAKDKYQKYLDKLQEYLENRKAAQKKREEEKNQKPEERLAALQEQARNHGYLSLSAKHWLATKPRYLIKRIEVSGISMGDSLPKQLVAITDVSSNPELHNKPMRMALEPEKGGEATAALEINDTTPDAAHKLTINLVKMPIGNDIKVSEKCPVDLAGGTATVKTEGKLAADAIELPFDLRLSGLKIAGKSGRPVLGMEPETAKEVFGSINELAIKGRLFGKLDSLQFEIDEDKLMAVLKDALVKAGKQALVNRMNKEVDEAKAKLKSEAEKKFKEEVGDKLKEKLGEEAGGKVGEVLKGTGGDVIKGVGNLFKGKDKDKEKKDDKEKKEKKKGGGLLDLLK